MKTVSFRVTQYPLINNSFNVAEYILKPDLKKNKVSEFLKSFKSAITLYEVVMEFFFDELYLVNYLDKL